MSQFRSLFIPTAEEEQAVFASVFPRLLTVPSAIESGAAAAAGERSCRASQGREGRAYTNTRHTSLYSPGTTSLSNSAATFTLAENSRSGAEIASPAYPRESASDAQVRRGAPLRSLIFAIGSARADAVVVVLRTSHIVVFGLDRVNTPPYELYRIRPLPTTQQLQVARGTSAAAKPRSSSERREELTLTAAEATCASLVPLTIAYCCRVSVSSESSRHGSAGGRAADPAEADIYIRGIVGGSDGRVSVFSDVAYTLSFAAHETPVTQVDAVLLPPCSLNTPSSYNTANTNTSLNTFANGSSSRPSSPTRAGADSSRGSPLAPPQQHQRRENLQRAMERLGIVTCGTDGVILLWRRIDGAMAPVVLLRPSNLARRVPYTVYHPSALSALLSATAPQSHREAAIDAELCCPPSCLLHATSQHAHGLRVRQFASLATRAPPAASTGTQGTTTTTTAVAAAAATPLGGLADAAERAAPTWWSLPMPGSWTASVTAMASHHGITLIAREATIFSLVRFDARAATRVWRAENAITQLVLQDTIALAVCAKVGAVHLLRINPVTGQGVHQRSYYTYKNRAIHHVSLHESALLMTVVDVCGSTELVQLPSDALLHQFGSPQHSSSHALGSAESLNLLASMAALRAKVSIEDVKGAGVCPDVSVATSSMYEANAALDELNERLLLARCAVPEECDRYMAANQHVF